jgi:ubiquinone/menaquinone biosynthesis C-methylase UbiE
MINVLLEKIQSTGVKNFDPILINLLDDDVKISKYDVIYTLMTLHHMPDIKRILKTFNSLITQNGYLCIADLVKEDGSYHAHENDFNEQDGFDRKELTEKLLEYNFKVEYYKECYVIEKEVDHQLRKYPLFIMIGKKIR